jgi:hypothetical protein
MERQVNDLNQLSFFNSVNLVNKTVQPAYQGNTEQH